MKPFNLLLFTLQGEKGEKERYFWEGWAIILKIFDVGTL